jgi:hypothetical protein
MRQTVLVSAYNFRLWNKNPRVLITFALCFILCFLLSDKTVRFSHEYGTVTQIVEAFVWTFDDSASILLSSSLLVLLFADMPFINAGTPFYLLRIKRRTWLFGQALYIVLATTIYMACVLASTSLMSLSNSFIGNRWSETAAILGYSGAGKAESLPALVKTLEMSMPYEAMGTIFLLMLLYTLLMAFVMLGFNIMKGQLAGVASVFVFSLFGFLLSPSLLQSLFDLPDYALYKANVAIGWISPLNHATYHMHSFGYDLLPRLWQTYALFGGGIILCFLVALWAIRRYSFNFTAEKD